MNESALNALTDPKPSKRAQWVVALARLLMAQYPRVLHPDEHRVAVQIIIQINSNSDIWSVVNLSSDVSISRFINDVRDVWEAFINDPSLLK